MTTGMVAGMPVLAQVPGVPGTQLAAPATAKYDANAGMISGQVKADAMVAEKLLSQGKWSDAEGLFREALINNPRDVRSTLGLGMALANQFKLDAADELFDRVINQDPNSPSAYAGKAIVILNRLQSSSGTIRAARDSMLKQAEDYAQHACALGPANAEAHYALGQVYAEQGRLAQAGSELATAVGLDPMLSYGYSALGKIKLDQNSLAEAQANFKRAADLNSSNSTAHYGLGATMLKLGQVDEAIKELNTSLYQFPNSWPVRMALGQAYQQQGNFVAALQQYQLSTLIKPENAEPYLRMAAIHQDRGDFELALADLRSGLSQSPYDISLRERIADLDLALERPDEAIKAYRTILEMNANEYAAVKGLSQALYLKAQKATVGAMLASNDYDTAIRSLAEAIKLNPNDMELRLAKVKLDTLSGANSDSAEPGSVVNAMTTSPPSNDGDRISYAQALMASGSFQKASEQLNAVIANQNDGKQAYAVADIATTIKALDSAQSAYKKGLSLGGAPDRGQRGLKQIAQLKQNAQEITKVANELAKKKQWEGAISKYREALGNNPTLAEARFGLAEALEKGPKDTPITLKESARQYMFYLSLAPDLTVKDKEKLSDLIEKLNDKAAKLQQKESKD